MGDKDLKEMKGNLFYMDFLSKRKELLLKVLKERKPNNHNNKDEETIIKIGRK